MRTYEDLERLAVMKEKLEKLAEVRAEAASACEIVDRDNRLMFELNVEYEQLQQECMAARMELKEINTDINLVENTIKQTEQERDLSRRKAMLSLQETAVLRSEINVLRSSLDLAPLSEDDGDRMMSLDPGLANVGTNLLTFPSLMSTPQHLSNAIMGNMMANPEYCFQQLNSDNNSFQSKCALDLSTPASNNNSASSSKAAHPPPMKLCASCQQQIHRNAPICPLCKCKSRSRNPKKPKQRRTDE